MLFYCLYFLLHFLLVLKGEKNFLKKKKVSLYTIVGIGNHGYSSIFSKEKHDFQPNFIVNYYLFNLETF